MEKLFELSLAKVRPNPHNPRRRFSGPDFDALVESIAAVGVLQPVLARPVKDKAATHEIVFGGRRLAACRILAERNGGLEKATIPARIRELTDSEAMDLMVIENLQRDDLTPLEEAEQFALYVKNHGPEIIDVLAQRVGCRPAYIRRRLMVQTLPKKILAAWDRGDIKIGHLEQLATLKDKKQILELFDEVIQYGWGVSQVRRVILNQAPKLERAKFDLEKAGCPTCQQSSAAQKSLFDLPEPEKVCCLSPKCFKQQQNNHFTSTWKRSGHRRKFKTNGFRFREDTSSGQVEAFAYKWDDPIAPPESCRECNEFITIIDLDGEAYISQACAGPAKCFKTASEEIKKATTKQGNTGGNDAGAAADPDAPRVGWHGEHFREEFYQTRLPEAIAAADPEDLRVARLALFCLIMSHDSIHGPMARQFNLAPAKDLKALEKGEWFRLDGEYAWSVISEMEELAVLLITREASRLAIMAHYYPRIRRKVADHFGIDLAVEWRPTPEYLQKKTKPELLAMVEKYDIVGRQPDRKPEANPDPAAALVEAVENGAAQKDIMEKFGFDTPGAMKKAYAAAMLDVAKNRPKKTNPKQMKKPELIGLFLADGVDLAGVVPDEILAD